MRRTILFLRFFPASLGIISQIFPPENLSAAILALGTLGMCMEQARMAAVDLVEIAQFQEKTSDPRLDRFFIVTVSTIVLELSGFYISTLFSLSPSATSFHPLMSGSQPPIFLP